MSSTNLFTTAIPGTIIEAINYDFIILGGNYNIHNFPDWMMQKN